MLKSTCKYIIVFVFMTSSILQAQNDTIRLKNNDVIVGEVKSFRTGVLTFKTSYSEEDFKIDFNDVIGLNVQRKYHVILTNGRRRLGFIKTDTSGMIIITLEDGSVEQFNLDEVTALLEFENKFWKRFNGGIDLSYNFTKANNNSQLTVGGQFEYINRKVFFEGSVNVLNSIQDDTDRVKRTEGSSGLKRILHKKWYLLGEFSYLKNTEQALDGRFTPNIGVGKFLVSTNKLYLGVSIGYAYIFENYVEPSLDKTSSEITIYGDFNMFDFDDIDIKSKIKFYPSLTEKGRIRTDYDLTVKYDLLLDFYIKTEFSLNYDNQPAIEGNEFDYIFIIGFGWEFD